MATYVVTGVSRGIGYGILELLTQNPANKVVGIVRNKAGTEAKIAADDDFKGRSNFFIIEGDLTKYSTLKKAAEDSIAFTGGKVDYLIENAGYISLFDAYDPIGAFADRPEELEANLNELWNINVVGNIHVINVFLPQILAGKTKKVIMITTGFADTTWTNEWDLHPGSLYSITKAAGNMAIAKYSAQYKSQGVLFVGVTPGMVNVGLYDGATPEDQEKLATTVKKFQAYNPDWKGPYTPKESAALMQKVWEGASIEKGHGGDMLSQFGNKQWI